MNKAVILQHRQTFRNLTGADRLLAFAFAGMIYLFHFLPEAATHIVRQHPAAIIAVVAVLAAYLLIRDWVWEKHPRVYFFSAGLYYSIVLAYGAFLTRSLAVPEPWLPWVLPLWGGSVYVWHRFRKMRLYLTATLIIAAPFFYNAARRSPDQRWLVAAGFLACAGICAGAIFRKKVVGLVRPTAVGFFAAATLLFPTVFARYQGIYPELAGRITAREGVSAVYRYDSPEFARVGSHFMFAALADGGVLLGPHDPCRYFYYLKGGEGDAGMKLESALVGTRAGDMAAYDPADPAALFVGSWGRLYKLNFRRFRIEKEVRIDAGLLNMLRVDAGRRLLYASQDRGKSVIRFNMDNPNDYAVSPPIGGFDRLFDVVLDPDANRFYAGGMGPDGWHIYEGDGRDMRILRQVVIREAYGFFMEIDPAKRRLFLASFLTGELFIVGLDDLRVQGKFFVCKSVRNLTFDPKRRLLFASDYFGGRLVVIDADALRVIDKIDVGPIVRHAQLDRAGDNLFIRTAAGVFSIDIDKALVK